MTLDLDDHLLQAPDALFATLLGHLALEVVLGALIVDLGLGLGIVLFLLGVFGDVLARCLFQSVNSRLGTGLGIDTRDGVVLLVLSNKSGGIGGIARTGRVSGLRSIAGGLLKVLLAERLVCVDLVLEVISRQIRNLVPRVLLGRVVDLCKLVRRWLDLGRSLGSSITGNGSRKDTSIAHWKMLV